VPRQTPQRVYAENNYYSKEQSVKETGDVPQRIMVTQNLIPESTHGPL
jgi:hypothetical protein